MQPKTAADFDQELLILFDAYVHGGIDRRGFLQQAQKFAAGGVSAAMLLASLSPDFSIAQVLPKGDGRIRTESVSYASAGGSGTMKGYLAMPANASGPLPKTLVTPRAQSTGATVFIEITAAIPARSQRSCRAARSRSDVGVRRMLRGSARVAPGRKGCTPKDAQKPRSTER